MNETILIITPGLQRILIVSLVFYVLVLIAIMLDLASGVKKAKLRKEATTSKGLRMTINKTVTYYSYMIIFTLIDIVATMCYLHNLINVPIAPYFTGFGTIILVIIEAKSIREKADQKVKKKIDQATEIVTNLMKDEDFVKKFKDGLVNKLVGKDGNNDENQ